MKNILLLSWIPCLWVINFACSSSVICLKFTKLCLFPWNSGSQNCGHKAVVKISNVVSGNRIICVVFSNSVR